jgi:hypothetical protein
LWAWPRPPEILQLSLQNSSIIRICPLFQDFQEDEWDDDCKTVWHVWLKRKVIGKTSITPLHILLCTLAISSTQTEKKMSITVSESWKTLALMAMTSLINSVWWKLWPCVPPS